MTIRLAPRTIAVRLLLWFLAISLIPCGVLTVVMYWISTRSLEQSVRRSLMVISEAKATELETFALERMRDAIALARAPSVVTAVTELNEAARAGPVDTPAYRGLVERHRTYLAYFADAFGYPNLFLLAPGGRVLLRMGPGLDLGQTLQTGPLGQTELAQVFDRSRTLLQPEMSDYQIYPGMSEPLAFIASPVLEEGAVVGVLVLQVNNKQVFQVFTDYTGLGETGETLVGSREGDVVTAVAPLRNVTEAATHLQVRMGSDRGRPLQYAVQGRRGFGAETDYRGRPVVAVWTYLPSFRWGMVVKQDAAEAFNLVSRQRLAMLLLLGGTLIPVVLVALVVARSISRPIQTAAAVADRVAAGDLTAQVSGSASDETGQLLRAIKTMTEDLRALIGRIQKSSVALMSTGTQIAATSRQQEQTVNEYGASTNQAVAAVKQISATSQELLKTMNEVNHVAGQTAEMANSGQASLARMDATMRLLANSTGSISSKLSVISERAGTINLAVTTITKVADQTNLLSINAAIEAEKAGEYGLGFLVVAREIRRLADMTAVATLDIDRMVKEMQYSVSAGVMEMDKFSDQVRQGVAEVGHISEQLGRIISAVQVLTGRFEEVNEGMRAQSQGAEQIREAMIRLNEGANQTALSLREFNKATDHLRDSVGGLKEEVSRFILSPAEPGPTAVVA
jgi:methyl-accepting chemotaxis protein WspA